MLIDETIGQYMSIKLNVKNDMSKFSGPSKAHERSKINRFHSFHTSDSGFDVLRGSWKVNGINDAIRFNVYRGANKESFKPHRDAQFCPSGDNRSFLSVVVYLNQGFQGGDTKFYFPKNTNGVQCKGFSMKDEIGET